jgi:molybdenum cofactor guanylyltransferase
VQVGGIVLAGGGSTRMGRTKADLDWHGAALVDRVSRVVRRGVGDGPVVVARAPGQPLPRLHPAIGVVDDAAPGHGPLAGIAAGLDALAAETRCVFVAATDHPFLHPLFVAAVVARLDETVDAALPSMAGHRYPLAACYRSTLRGIVADQLAAGQLRVLGLLDRVRVRMLDADLLQADPALRRADPDLDSLTNINDEAGYRAALRRPLGPVTIRRDDQGGGGAVNAAVATLAQAAAMVGVDPSQHTVTIDGRPLQADPSFPLARGDVVVFRRP